MGHRQPKRDRRWSSRSDQSILTDQNDALMPRPLYVEPEAAQQPPGCSNTLLGIHSWSDDGFHERSLREGNLNVPSEGSRSALSEFDVHCCESATAEWPKPVNLR